MRWIWSPTPAPGASAGAGGSLARRVLLTVSLVVGTLVSIEGTISIHRERQAAWAALHERAELLAEVQARSLAAAIWDYDDVQAQAVVDALAQDPDFRCAAVRDPDGAVLIERVGGAEGNGDVVVEREITVSHADARGPLGSLRLVLSADRLEREMRRAMVFRQGLLGLFVLSVLLVIHLTFRRISQPLQAMAGAMTALAGGDLALPVPSLRRDDEIGDIARALQVFKDNAIEVERLRSDRERLAAAERERIRAAVESCSDAVAIADGAGRLTYVNPAFVRLLGLTVADVDRLGGPLRLLPERGTRRSLVRQLRAAGTWSVETALRTAAGVEARVALRISRIQDAGDETVGFVALASDIGERLAAAARLHHLAHHDPLTGLPNRVLFGIRLDDALSQAARQQRGLSILLLDLDGFKHVNDTFGHSVGDRLLVEVGRRLQACADGTSTIARIGGDEFAILLPLSGDQTDAAELAGRVLRTLALPVPCEGQEIDTGTSVGISRFPDDGTTAEALLQCADLALYRAKAQGRGTCRFFEAQFAAEASHRKRIEQDLRRALQNGELALHYQLQLDIASGQAAGAEVLVRWQHPRDGMISPAAFIPIAEENGLIAPLGEWVLDEACRWLASGDPATARLQLAVNVSAAQFRGDLVGMVERVLERRGVDPRRLELEITETAILNDTGSTLAQLCQLRAMGIGLALDDFGTGFGSLTYLRRFPFTRLKIDRSFVAELERDADAAAIVRSVIELGHQLRLRVTAEGIETAGQLALLRSLGCDDAQGYFIGRPVPAEALATSLRRPRLVATDGSTSRLATVGG